MSEPRWTETWTSVNGVPITVTQPEDPAYALLMDPDVHSETKPGVLFDDSCYICLDAEFAQMGMPLCYPCERCKADESVPHSGHVPADDTICTECGEDAQELYYKGLEQQCAVNGHQIVHHDRKMEHTPTFSIVNGKLVTGSEHHWVEAYDVCAHCHSEIT